MEENTSNGKKQGGGKGAEMMAVMWALTGVTTFIVVARLFIRQKLRCAAATAIVKCAQIKGLADKEDPTYGTVPLVIWTNVEANVVVIASCIPTLQPLLELILGKRKLTSNGKSNSRHKYYQQSSQQGNEPSSQSNLNNSRRSRYALHKQDITLTTNVESRESILREERGDFDSTVTVTSNEGGGGVGPLHIRRTDDVHIEYEMQTQTPLEPTQKRSFG